MQGPGHQNLRIDCEDRIGIAAIALSSAEPARRLDWLAVAAAVSAVIAQAPTTTGRLCREIWSSQTAHRPPTKVAGHLPQKRIGKVPLRKKGVVTRFFGAGGTKVRKAKGEAQSRTTARRAPVCTSEARARKIGRRPRRRPQGSSLTAPGDASSQDRKRLQRRRRPLEAKGRRASGRKGSGSSFA